MTVHTGIGCSYACSYCYIYDMGFPAEPRPYPLSPLELVYALSANPYVVPRRTLAALGSVTEPFLPETRSRALEYVSSLRKYLKLLTQVSTKSVLEEGLASGLYSADPSISVLVTVVTLRNRRLEPRAPDPLERLEAAGRAARRGLKVSLFLRPLIPGAAGDAEEVVRAAADFGVGSVVVGSLRVTESILLRLRASGVDVGDILRRLKTYPRGSRQVPVPSSDLKDRVSKLARECGLRVFRAACEANTWSHGVFCSMCGLGPCNTEFKPLPVSGRDVEDLVEYLGLRALDVSVEDTAIRARVGGSRSLDYLKYLLSAATYRKVIVS
ncbi:MAG: radical SAM protein [Sulfolobales archaeon]|nr:hypothetical protein [Sulfolobales archaeon]MCX8208521.1 hypothetical protein [Sulfolobales archaeon]MDW8010355.1 radical SAM protein [Sulfolobales archaeon]